jgi:hypothetical protein
MDMLSLNFFSWLFWRLFFQKKIRPPSESMVGATAVVSGPQSINMGDAKKGACVHVYVWETVAPDRQCSGAV